MEKKKPHEGEPAEYNSLRKRNAHSKQKIVSLLNRSGAVVFGKRESLHDTRSRGVNPGEKTRKTNKNGKKKAGKEKAGETRRKRTGLT